MPRAPVPTVVAEFLAKPHPAVIASSREDCAPHSAPTWYDWEDGRVLVNGDHTRRRVEYLREGAPVSLTVLDGGSWYHHVTVEGSVDEVRRDDGLRDIDRLSTRYLGQPFGNRESVRVSMWIRVERWHGWNGGRPWPPRD